MPSSFFGLYTAQRSLTMNQAAMNVVSNNIANMNTEGFSKQRIEFSQKSTMQTNVFLPEVAAQNGIGATIDDITRNRDVFLDSYFRDENSQLSYFEQLNSTTVLIEDITNELNGTGVSASLNGFYEAAQLLSKNPTDIVSRTNFLQNAVDVCTILNNTDDQLGRLRTSLVGNPSDTAYPLDPSDPTGPQTTNSIQASSLGLAVEDLNTMLNDIAKLNETIALTTAQGSTPNNLLDQRDLLLDNLSELIPIKVTQNDNNLVTVSIDNFDLVKGDRQLVNFTATLGNDNNPCIVQMEDRDGGIVSNNANPIIDSGKIGALIGLGGSDPSIVTVKGIQDDLDLLARELAREINNIQANGQYIDESGANPVLAEQTPNTNDIFVDKNQTGANTDDFIFDYNEITASTIAVNKNILDNPFKIATASVTTPLTATTESYTGDSTNALAFAKLRDKEIGNLNNSTTESFLNSVNGDLGIKSSSIYDNYYSQSQIVDEVVERRTSMTGVNLDEEYIDLVKFQKAYQASSRIYSVMEEAIQTILNLV